MYPIVRLIRDELERSGRTQTWLARASYLSLRTVQHVLSDSGNPSAATIDLILRALKVEITLSPREHRQERP
jgi:DNA-binding phage protein